jgi:hypothetical protein
MSGVPREVDRAFEVALRREAVERPSDVEAWVASFVEVLEAMDSGGAGWPGTISGRPGAGSSPDLPTREMPGA